MANLTITDDGGALSESINHENGEEIYKKCFTLPDYYRQCLSFYHKGKDVIKMSYQDKIRLTALWKQAQCGKYDISKIPEVGYFDVVGNDRKLAWEGLGDMSKTKAMEEFCSLMERLAPELEAYLEAQYQEIEEKKRKEQEELEQRRREEEEERRRKEEEERIEKERLFEEEQKRKVAEEAEQERIKHESLEAEKQKLIQHRPQLNGTLSIAPASLWSRPKVQEFIQHVRTDPGSVLVVGRGETITVRVPTHDNGTCLFWEFATESYDVGFGVCFEWSLPSSEAITFEVEENEEDPSQSDDAPAAETPEVRIDEILPTIRRPCNEEVMVGSHLYPGRGVYLLKFDNSYSLFRAKTLFYRVYYTR